MDWERAGAIAVGGVLGASLRWALLSSTASTGRIPWMLVAVNGVGSVLLGVVLAEEWKRPQARLWLRDLGGIGFCGGLTTFSTFSVEIAALLRDDHLGTALGYGALSVVAAIAGFVAGAAALRRVRAVVLPLEGQP